MKFIIVRISCSGQEFVVQERSEGGKEKRGEMAGIYLAKKGSINVYKASLKHQPSFVDSAIRVSRACFSTGSERAEGSNAAAGTRGEGTGPDGTPGVSSETSKDPVGQGIYEAKHQALDMDENTTTGATQFVADTAKEGVRKATERADAVGDTAKRAVDSASEASKEANHKVRDTVAGGKDNNENHNNHNEEDPGVVEMQKMDGPIDTVEYRNLEINIEEMSRSA
ncbi:uncharacterized protein LOC8287913 [Ricinus communis]|uniref:uncharacterized protein LOC8287913 n=1 Tax=Ricinus communis TaxID=3988 RepID=UPI00201B1177|nr:uncharacterized protein LOC8287913 [Ricinus communis]